MDEILNWLEKVGLRAGLRAGLVDSSTVVAVGMEMFS